MERAEQLLSVSAISTGLLVPQPLPGQSEGWPGRGQNAPFLCTHLLCKSKADLSFPCTIVFDEKVLQLSLSSAALLRIFVCGFLQVAFLPKLCFV